METTTLTTTKWNIDNAHSEVQFKIKHLMISTVTGSFKTFAATAEMEGNDFSTAKISFSAETNSIFTNNEQRDGHLKGPDFFDAEKFAYITFISTGIKKKDDENYEVTGDLTIRDVIKPVTLNIEFTGLMKDPWGNQKAGFNINGKISRKEWGLTWNAALEAGGVMVSDEVKLMAEVQMVKA